MFPSKYLKAEDFDEDEKRAVTIKDVAQEEFTNRQKGGATEKKFILHSREEKPLVLNKTNADVLFKMLGEDTDDWIGQRVLLAVKEVDSFGDIVRAVRVLSQRPKDAPREARATRPARQDEYDDHEEEPRLSSDQRDRIIELAAIEWPNREERKAQMQKLLPCRLDDLRPEEADGVIATLEKPPARKAPQQAQPDDFDDSDPFADVE